MGWLNLIARKQFRRRYPVWLKRLGETNVSEYMLGKLVDNDD